jgi:hypothetical protein
MCSMLLIVGKQCTLLQRGTANSITPFCWLASSLHAAILEEAAHLSFYTSAHAGNAGCWILSGCVFLNAAARFIITPILQRSWNAVQLSFG